jgi:predicted O-methyltransferase YrrM
MKIQHAWRLMTTHGWFQSQTRDLWIHVRSATASDPFAAAYRTVRPYTMSGGTRLRALYDAVQDTTTRAVPGAIVECGTAKGGSAALLGLSMKNSGASRTLWVFDTFEGIPPPTLADPDFEVASLYTGSFRGELEMVRTLFDRLGLADCAHFVKGRFQDTVPACDTGPIAVLHIDGDWYESVKVCLDTFYDRVSRGGIVQIDDYGHWEGARKATDEFLSTRGLNLELQYIDYTGRRLVKP